MALSFFEHFGTSRSFHRDRITPPEADDGVARDALVSVPISVRLTASRLHGDLSTDKLSVRGWQAAYPSRERGQERSDTEGNRLSPATA